MGRRHFLEHLEEIGRLGIHERGAAHIAILGLGQCRVDRDAEGDGELLLQLLGLLFHLLTLQECSFKGESQCKNVHTSVSEPLFLTKNVCSCASCAGQFHLLGEIPLLRSF